MTTLESTFLDSVSRIPVIVLARTGKSWLNLQVRVGGSECDFKSL